MWSGLTSKTRALIGLLGDAFPEKPETHTQCIKLGGWVDEAVIIAKGLWYLALARIFNL